MCSRAGAPLMVIMRACRRGTAYLRSQIDALVLSEARTWWSICAVVGTCAGILFFEGNGVLELLRNAEGLGAIGGGLLVAAGWRRRKIIAKRTDHGINPSKIDAGEPPRP